MGFGAEVIVGGGGCTTTGAKFTGASDLVAEGAEDFFDAPATHGVEGLGAGHHAFGCAVAIVAAEAEHIVDGSAAVIA